MPPAVGDDPVGAGDHRESEQGPGQHIGRPMALTLDPEQCRGDDEQGEGWVRRLSARAGLVFAWAIETRARADELLGLGLRGLIMDDLGLIDELRSHSLR